MGQRLGIASALLADPATILLDEPVNGLDPEGVLWIRNLLKGLAAEGRTVFVSSHLMSEMALTADHLIIVGRGRLIRDSSVTDFIAEASSQSVRVRTPEATRLRDLLVGAGCDGQQPRTGRAERRRAVQRADRLRRGAGRVCRSTNSLPFRPPWSRPSWS